MMNEPVDTALQPDKKRPARGWPVKHAEDPQAVAADYMLMKL